MPRGRKPKVAKEIEIVYKPMKKKIVCDISGTKPYINATKALRENGMEDKAIELEERLAKINFVGILTYLGMMDIIRFYCESEDERNFGGERSSQ